MIRLESWIDAPVERCFLLSLNIDLHVDSAYSRERAIDGVTTGLIGEGQTVTFRGGDFGGLWRRHTFRFDAVRPYTHFRDVMIRGAFPCFEHEHHFATMNDGTRIRDELRYIAPGGAIGRMLARRRLVRMLIRRSGVMKRVAESEQWREYLNGSLEILPTFLVGASPRWDANSLLRRSTQIPAHRWPHA